MVSGYWMWTKTTRNTVRLRNVYIFISSKLMYFYIRVRHSPCKISANMSWNKNLSKYRNEKNIGQPENITHWKCQNKFSVKTNEKSSLTNFHSKTTFVPLSLTALDEILPPFQSSNSVRLSEISTALFHKPSQWFNEYDFREVTPSIQAAGINHAFTW